MGNWTDINLGKASGWFKLFVGFCVAGFVINFFQGADGVTCGRGWNVWLPQTWATPVSCFIRNTTKEMPSPGYSTETLPKQTTPTRVVD